MAAVMRAAHKLIILSRERCYEANVAMPHLNFNLNIFLDLGQSLCAHNIHTAYGKHDGFASQTHSAHNKKQGLYSAHGAIKIYAGDVKVPRRQTCVKTYSCKYALA